MATRNISGGALTPVYIWDSQAKGQALDNSLFVRFGDSPSIDAFARMRVSEPTTLFDSQNQYDKSPLFWDEAITESATSTHLPNESAVRLRATNGERIIRQTRQYYRYQPGKSQFILCTFAGVHSNEENAIKLVGYGDDQNGIFLKSENGINYIVMRSFTSGSAVDTNVSQANWNLDNFDGGGASGITLDLTKSQIFLIDLEWLGVGRVRVGFVMNGIPYYAHEFNNSNIGATVYMTTANLPIRYEVDCRDYTGGGNVDLIQICSQIASEGGFEFLTGIPFSAGNGATTVSVTTRRPICSVRPKTTFNSIVNRCLIIPEGTTGYAEDVSTFFEVVYGGALTNASFADVNSSSAVEFDVAATAITGGIRVALPYYAAALTQGTGRIVGTGSGSLLSRLPLALTIGGAHPTTPLTDNLTLVATSLTGAATDTAGMISWREIR